ncbi:hypothetical protein DMC30DRAFT_133252 [Rhodotorula diobovata]|uniref:Uncharacterized protein n=1 Tax=Rhodotorula diobovata TaxID=5288 RepID=A0A5C5FKC9_9BASI|nr:hypothetical protein DMC30DRAFT_133252 [Rhodotorula diobovata]
MGEDCGGSTSRHHVAHSPASDALRQPIRRERVSWVRTTHVRSPPAPAPLLLLLVLHRFRPADHRVPSLLRPPHRQVPRQSTQPATTALLALAVAFGAIDPRRALRRALERLLRVARTGVQELEHAVERVLDEVFGLGVAPRVPRRVAPCRGGRLAAGGRRALVGAGAGRRGGRRRRRAGARPKVVACALASERVYALAGHLSPLCGVLRAADGALVGPDALVGHVGRAAECGEGPPLCDEDARAEGEAEGREGREEGRVGGEEGEGERDELRGLGTQRGEVERREGVEWVGQGRREVPTEDVEHRKERVEGRRVRHGGPRARAEVVKGRCTGARRVLCIGQVEVSAASEGPEARSEERGESRDEPRAGCAHRVAHFPTLRTR